MVAINADPALFAEQLKQAREDIEALKRNIHQLAELIGTVSEVNIDLCKHGAILNSCLGMVLDSKGIVKVSEVTAVLPEVTRIAEVEFASYKAERAHNLTPETRADTITTNENAR